MLQVKENFKVEEIANKSVGKIKDSIEEIETVTFWDYKQEDGVLETDEQLVNEDLPSLSTKESNVTKGIEKNNPTNTGSVKGDILSNRSGCYPTFDHLNKNGYFEKHNEKLTNFSCHGVDDILYPS